MTTLGWHTDTTDASSEGYYHTSSSSTDDDDDHNDAGDTDVTDGVPFNSVYNRHGYGRNDSSNTTAASQFFFERKSNWVGADDSVSASPTFAAAKGCGWDSRAPVNYRSSLDIAFGASSSSPPPTTTAAAAATVASAAASLAMMAAGGGSRSATPRPWRRGSSSSSSSSSTTRRSNTCSYGSLQATSRTIPLGIGKAVAESYAAAAALGYSRHHGRRRRQHRRLSSGNIGSSSSVQSSSSTFLDLGGVSALPPFLVPGNDESNGAGAFAGSSGITNQHKFAVSASTAFRKVPSVAPPAPSPLLDHRALVHVRLAWQIYYDQNMKMMRGSTNKKVQSQLQSLVID